MKYIPLNPIVKNILEKLEASKDFIDVCFFEKSKKVTAKHVESEKTITININRHFSKELTTVGLSLSNGLYAINNLPSNYSVSEYGNHPTQVIAENILCFSEKHISKTGLSFVYSKDSFMQDFEQSVDVLLKNSPSEIKSYDLVLRKKITNDPLQRRIGTPVDYVKIPEAVFENQQNCFVLDFETVKDKEVLINV